MARANAFWPTAVVGEADSVNSVSASACHIGGPKGVSPGQKVLLHGKELFNVTSASNMKELGAFLCFCFDKDIGIQLRLAPSSKK